MCVCARPSVGVSVSYLEFHYKTPRADLGVDGVVIRFCVCVGLGVKQKAESLYLYLYFCKP